MNRANLRRESDGLVLLACALVFGALALRAEVRIGLVPLNDAVFHLAAAERLIESFALGEPFLDPWVSEWSLGYPLWRSYQPLPHLLAAGWLLAAKPFADPTTAFSALQYLLLVALPASIYVGARLFGLTSLAAGLASLLAILPSEAGEFGRYGLGYGAFVWRGSGLFTQLVALHALALGLGCVARALEAGRGRVLAALLLAATALSHLVFGYIAFVAAFLLALVGAGGERSRRVLRFATIAALALIAVAWFFVPLAKDLGAVNHSRWELEYKWDSFGAPKILDELVSGRLLDSGRGPWLSLLLLVGAGVAVRRIREPLPRRLLTLTVVWLALFFGRATWGRLLSLALVPGDLHLHRLQAAFEICAVLLAAWGIERCVRGCWDRARPLGMLCGVGLVAALGAMAAERWAFLLEGARWGDDNLAAYARERTDVDAALGEVKRILAERPGRVSAGLAAAWGGAFKVGAVPFYAFLTRAHLDQASFLYHAMSPASDVMVLRSDDDPVHALAFGVRAVVAPRDRPMPASFRPRASHGRLAVYEVSPEGYFGLVDLAGRYTGPPSSLHEPSAAWLRSRLPSAGAAVALDPRAGDSLPPVARWQPLPPPPAESIAACGRVVEEARQGETYRARFSLARACHALVKIGWHPGLVANVDGSRVPLLRVTPEFGAVPLAAGEHDVVVAYRPGPLKPLLLVLGAVVFVIVERRSRGPRVAVLESSWAAQLGSQVSRWATPRARAAAALALTGVVALRPLARGRLVAGHDALEYPPRLVEFARAVADGHLPPLWAADLGSGHGQPLFGFAPPLLYAAALPFHAAGQRLADSLQLALALLFALGAAAVYRLGRRAALSRVSAVCGAAAWLFAPYTALVLFVRSAFAEATAVAVAPLAALLLWRALDRPGVARAAAAGLAVALLPLAHNGAALLLLPALALCVAIIARGSERPARTAASGAAAIGLALLLSAFFWLPAFVEKQHVQTELLRQDFLHWSQHAATLGQLLWSGWGFGVSDPGPKDGMSFALGPVHLLLAAAGFWLALRRPDHRRRYEAIALLTVALLGAWLASDASSWLWARVEPLQYLAYPWRALLLPGLALPLLALPAFERFGARRAIAAAAVLVVFNLPHTEPGGYHTYDDEYYAPLSIAEKGINTTTREEYTPRWVERRPPYSADRLQGRAAKLEIASARLTSALQDFVVRAPRATEVEAATFHYPGWSAEVDGVPVALEPVPVHGTMRFQLPAGEHRVVLELRPTRLRRAAGFVSLTALLVTLGAAFARRAQSRG